MTDIHELLKKLDACKESQEWASTRTWEQIYNECHRGDWLCWLFSRTNPDDIQLSTLVKGHQANTVRHLMEDERSRAAVDAAIAFGKGKISIEELRIFAFNARTAFNAAYANAAYTAADAADYAAAADAAAYAAYAANAAYAAAYAANAANAADYAAAYAANAADYAAAYATNAADYKKKNQQETADIFRKFIKITDFNL